MRALAVTAMLIVVLGGCGARADLKPAAGKELPVAPFGRDDRPKAAELLKPAPQAAPERSVELRRKSEERTDDPFDLPPSDE